MIPIRWQTDLPHWLVLGGFVVLAGVNWPTLPDHVPLLWTMFAHDGMRSGNKVAGVLVPLVIAVGLYLFPLFLPRLDPGHANYAQFLPAYAIIRLVALVILLALYVILLLEAHGRHLNTTLLLIVLMGCLCIPLGSVMGKLRPNWFVGIRTPWTLSSKRSWGQTHRLAGWLLLLVGGCFLAAGLSGASTERILPFLIGITSVYVLTLPLYSYLVWRSDPQKIPPLGTSPANHE